MRHQLSADDRAVSEIVGAVLIIAIGVFLAAVLATGVIGSAAAPDTTDPGTYTFQWVGENDSLLIEYLNGDQLTQNNTEAINVTIITDAGTRTERWMGPGLDANGADDVLDPGDNFIIDPASSGSAYWGPPDVTEDLDAGDIVRVVYVSKDASGGRVVAECEIPC